MTSYTLLRVTGIALVVSLCVWYINFRDTEHLVGAGDSLRSINSRLQLSGGDGKLHVLVTGGAGFIGSHATLALLQRGHSVTVVDNMSRGNVGALLKLHHLAPERFKFYNVDLGDYDSLLEVFTNANIDAVLHFAAVAYVGESVAQPLRYFANITTNTMNVLRTMQEAKVKKLVYSSTCAVYGNPTKLPVTEETIPKPINPYGEAKLFAEAIIKDHMRANSDMQAVILRYFNVYGSDPAGRLGEYPKPELRHMGRISGACMDAAMGVVAQLKVMGTTHPTPDGSCIRDYIHVCDLVDAHIAALENLSNPPEVYNIGTGKGVSVKQFVAACKKVTGINIQVEEVSEPRPGDYAEVWADPTKINRAFNWRANYTNIEDGLMHAWSWRTKNPFGY